MLKQLTQECVIKYVLVCGSKLANVCIQLQYMNRCNMTLNFLVALCFVIESRELWWAGNVAQISETNTLWNVSFIRTRSCEDTSQTNLTAVWDVTSCGLVYRNHRFE
jgi:hypothetical protein